jgi:hypothetical protein
MDIIIPILIAVALVSFVLFVVPRIEVIHPTIRMVIIATTLLLVVIWLLRSILPRAV